MEEEDKLKLIYKQLRQKIKMDERRNLVKKMIELSLDMKRKGAMKKSKIGKLETAEEILHKIKREKERGNIDLVNALVDMLQSKMVELHRELLHPSFEEREDGKFELKNWDWNHGIEKGDFEE